MKNVAVKKGGRILGCIKRNSVSKPSEMHSCGRKSETDGVVREDLLPQLKKSLIHGIKITAQKDLYQSFWVSLGLKRKDTVYVQLDLKSLKGIKTWVSFPFRIAHI